MNIMVHICFFVIDGCYIQYVALCLTLLQMNILLLFGVDTFSLWKHCDLEKPAMLFRAVQGFIKQASKDQRVS